LLPGTPFALRAQGNATVVVRVRLADATSGAPVDGAEVSIVRGLRTVIAQEMTDETGLRVLFVKNDSSDYQVVVRKIGYRRADRFFPTGSRDTVAVNIPMSRIAQTLEAVKITAREDLARKAYYIDDEEISKSDRPLFTSVDIIEKLRPDMVWGHAGPGVCSKIQSVFVNGRRIIQAPAAGIEAARARAAPGSASRLRTARGTRADPDKYKVTGMAAAILAMIKPEHIAEMTYNDCFEKSVKINRGANAVFIVLKPGIGYSMEDGSYVIDAPVPRSLAPATAPASPSSRATAPASGTSSPLVASYRVRILGVFDADSGEFVEGAEVVDVLTGTKAVTTRTGTVSLAFLPEGGSEVRIQKPGYKTITIEVLISPRDTVPVTITLAKIK
jgi:hypothetical protein